MTAATIYRLIFVNGPVGIAASREKLVEMFQSMIDYDIADREGLFCSRSFVSLSSFV